MRRMRAMINLGAIIVIGLFGVTACGGDRADERFVAGPKAYIEFYIPSDDPVQAVYKVDASVYRLDGGKRVFDGMTRKNRDSGASKHNLVVTVPPGAHRFEIDVAGGTTAFSVAVDDGVYQPVRIWFSGATRDQLMGMSNKIQFKVHLAADPPVIPTRPGQTQAGAESPR
ncbi:MAG: hypothetical protein ACFCUG_04690 [Thiotrichales bacterium]